MLARISSASLVQRSRTQIARFGVLSNCHLGNQIAEHIGGSARGYQELFALLTICPVPDKSARPDVSDLRGPV
jgi:hypothetical protein